MSHVASSFKRIKFAFDVLTVYIIITDSLINALSDEQNFYMSLKQTYYLTACLSSRTFVLNQILTILSLKQTHYLSRCLTNRAFICVIKADSLINALSVVTELFFSVLQNLIVYLLSRTFVSN